VADKAHKILPHGDVESPIDGVWMVRGIAPFPLRRYMTVWKRPDGALVAHSVIAMDDARLAQLDALGKVATIIVPHTGHRLDAPFYKRRTPDARVVAPKAARAKVEEVLPVDATSEDELPQHGVTVHQVPGWKHGELGYEFALPGGGRALVLSDVVATKDPAPGFGGWFMDLLAGGVKGTLAAPRIIRRMMLVDREAARAGIARLADIPDLRIISIAHGRPVLSDCATALRDAAARL
jgi:hypothetical protein